jgi:hypothetical protein
MRPKWFSFLAVALFILGLTACQTTENRGAQTICKPGSAPIGSTGEGGAITIAWDPNKEPELAGYRIYYGTASGSYKSCVDIGNPPKSPSGYMQYTLTGLEKGKKYYIAVTAYDKNKDASGFSGEVSDVAK